MGELHSRDQESLNIFQSSSVNFARQCLEYSVRCATYIAIWKLLGILYRKHSSKLDPYLLQLHVAPCNLPTILWASPGPIRSYLFFFFRDKRMSHTKRLVCRCHTHNLNKRKLILIRLVGSINHQHMWECTPHVVRVRMNEKNLLDRVCGGIHSGEINVPFFLQHALQYLH